MKIVIYPNYGSSYVPPFMRKQLSKKDWTHNRIELAGIIEKLEPTHDEITQEIYNSFDQGWVHVPPSSGIRRKSGAPGAFA